MDTRLTPADEEHYPTLTEAGREMLRFLREHPAAPLYRNESGNRLEPHEVEALRAFEREIAGAAVGWPPGALPHWVSDFVARTFEDAPFYKALGSPARRFEDLPIVSRADFAADIVRFVPDSVAADRLINFRTTGTTGHPLLIASHPVVAARYLAFHKRALRRVGIELTHARGQVGVVLLGFQKQCFTYVSVTPVMDESGLAKINLHPDDWRDPLDRARYLDALDPEVYSGDPLSFAELMRLPMKTRPRALISVSMALSPALRRTLETHFGCPVLDVYSLNETGPVSVFDESLGGHLLLQPALYVEILDARGRTLPAGERGEITLTGGFNFCLPLLRYRTGDHAALDFSAEGPVLVGLSGRPPVRFRTERGWINNIDVTHALGFLPLPQFAVHQRRDGGVVLRLPAAAMTHGEAARKVLGDLFGSIAIGIAAFAQDDKIVQYTSDLEDSTP